MKKNKKIDPLLNRTPPHNVDAENCVLSSIFGQKGALTKAREWLKPDDFYKGAHKKIFAAILESSYENGISDVTVVADCLDKKSQLEGIGGEHYLLSIMNEMPMAPSVEEYSKIIFRCSVKRFALDQASEIITMALEDDIDVALFMVRINKLNSEIGEFANRGDGVQNLSISLDDLFDGASDMVETPHEVLNEKIQGFGPGELIVVAGKSGMGKTAFCLGQLIHTVVDEGREVIYCGAQMSDKRIMIRILAQMCKVKFRKLLAGRPPRDMLRKIHAAHKKIESSKLIKHVIIDDEIEVSELQRKVNVAIEKSKKKPALVIIENLQQLYLLDHKFRNEFEKASFIVKVLKPWIQKIDIATIVSSQLNRELDKRDDKRPKPTDIFGKDAEESADTILLFHRPNVYEKREIDEVGRPEIDAEIIIGKGGPPAIIPMIFWGDYMKWEEKLVA